MHYLILGAGAAGLAAVEAIRGRDPKGQITLCSAEAGPPYSLCALPDLVAGEIDEEVLFTTTNDQLKRLSVDLRSGWQAETLEATGEAKGKVRFSNQEVLDFDTLLIATGSEPLLPRLPGLDRPGMFTHLDLAGCKALLAALPQAARVAIIGGGFLGVEMAQALIVWSKRRGTTQLAGEAKLAQPASGANDLQVVLVEMEERLLASMLDAQRSELARKHLEDLGLEVKVNARVVELMGQGENGPLQGLACADGDPVICDLAVMAVGVRPSIGWLEGSGLETGSTGGLLINEHMGTGLPGVFAAGDVVEAWDPISGQRGLRPTWTNAAEQGRIAGLNMAATLTSTSTSIATLTEDPEAQGQSRAQAQTPIQVPAQALVESYPGWNDFNVVHIHDVPFVSCGQVNDLPTSIVKLDSPVQLKGARGRPCQTSLYLEDDRLIGVCSMELPANIGHLHTVISQGKRLPDPAKASRLFFETSLLARRKVRPVGATSRETKDKGHPDPLQPVPHQPDPHQPNPKNPNPQDQQRPDPHQPVPLPRTENSKPGRSQFET